MEERDGESEIEADAEVIEGEGESEGEGVEERVGDRGGGDEVKGVDACLCAEGIFLIFSFHLTSTDTFTDPIHM